MSDYSKNEKLLDFNNSPSLSFNSPLSLPSPLSDLKFMQSPSQSPSTIQLLGTPDSSSAKSYFLPTGFDYACEYVKSN